MNRIAIIALRVLILLIGVGALGAQIVIVPVVARVVAENADYPEFSVPYGVVGIVVIACVEVALVALWILLSMVQRGRIFSARAFRFVDLIIGAGAVATVLVFLLNVHIYYVIEPHLDAPGIILVLLCLTILGAAFVALLVVMRSLLRSATSLQAELEEVV